MRKIRYRLEGIGVRETLARRNYWTPDEFKSRRQAEHWYMYYTFCDHDDWGRMHIEPVRRYPSVF